MTDYERRYPQFVVDALKDDLSAALVREQQLRKEIQETADDLLVPSTHTAKGARRRLLAALAGGPGEQA